MSSSVGFADGVGRRLHSAPGLDLSKTPTAEMEHALHGPSPAPVSQVSVASGAKVLDMGAVLEKKARRVASGRVLVHRRGERRLQGECELRSGCF